MFTFPFPLPRPHFIAPRHLGGFVPPPPPAQVLCFQNPGACCLVAEGVEEQRGAVLAFPTVGLVEMFRGVASMSSNSVRKNSSGSATDAAAYVK